MGILFSRQTETDNTKIQPVLELPVNKESEQTLPETIVPETTVPETTVPETIVPLETVSDTTSVVTENLDPKTSDIFERHIEELPGNKVEVVPVNVNPEADVVKKSNKKKNKKPKH